MILVPFLLGALDKFCHQMIETGLNKKIVLGCNMRFAALNQAQYNLIQGRFSFLPYGLESGKTNKPSTESRKNTKVKDAHDSLFNG